MNFIDSLGARASQNLRRIVFCEANDPRVLEAARALQQQGILEPVLVGTRDHATSDVEFIDVSNSTLQQGVAADLLAVRGHKGMNEAEARRLAASPLYAAQYLVRSGAADGAVSGAVYTTGDVIKAALWLIGIRPEVKSLSSAFYMAVPDFRDAGPEVITFTDCAVIRQPNATQLADIAQAASLDRCSIVGDEPRVAFLSFSTHGSGHSDSVDRIREAVTILRDRAPGLAVDGELQGDAALIEAVAARKAPSSAVAGRANVLVFPDLDSGNISYKLVQRLAHARAIGPILQGLNRPSNDLSRGASAEDIFNVAALTALQAAEHATTGLNGFRRETRT